MNDDKAFIEVHVLKFTSKAIDEYDRVDTGMSLWLTLPVIYVLHRQYICKPKTSFFVGIPYMDENVVETVVLHVRQKS